MKLAATFTVLLLLLSTGRTEDTSSPAAYGIEEKVAGKTSGEWSAEWWKWALEAKKDRNPVTDKTGEFAHLGQPEKVWFLAGNFGGVSKRKCTISADRPVFVAVFNYIASQPVKDRDGTAAKKFVEEVRAEAKDIIDRAELLKLEVDGKEFEGLKKYRAVSPLFVVNGLSEQDSVHPSFSGKQSGVSDGYWVMLKPLSAGEHTIRVRSKMKPKAGEPDFEMDVTYQLTVKAAK